MSNCQCWLFKHRGHKINVYVPHQPLACISTKKKKKTLSMYSGKIRMKTMGYGSFGCCWIFLRPWLVIKFIFQYFYVRNIRILVKNDKRPSSILNFKIFKILSFKKMPLNLKFHQNIQPNEKFLPTHVPVVRNFKQQKFLEKKKEQGLLFIFWNFKTYMVWLLVSKNFLITHFGLSLILIIL